jgi:Protein of unknown function (DUF3011)
MRALILALISTLAFAGAVQAQYYHEDYDDGSQVICESKKGRTQYCSIDTTYGVELVEQYSRSACIEGESWGYDRRGVWVQSGCRAAFVASEPPRRGRGRDDRRDRDYGYDDGGQIEQVLIRCESHNHEPFYCQMPSQGRVQLINQLSRAACRQGSDWGYDRRGVWVANGCRAEFAVEILHR